VNFGTLNFMIKKAVNLHPAISGKTLIKS